MNAMMEIYDRRRQFFNDHAGKWLDTWYKDPATGRHDKHEKDFQRLFSLLPLKKGDRVLDAGCGVGVLVPFILEKISESGILYELDYAEKMIEINRRMHKGGNIRFIIYDVEKVPLADCSCDFVVCFSSFPHFHDRKRALTNLVRIMKPQGILAIAHFASAEKINNHHHSCSAVMHDHLPDREQMNFLMNEAKLHIDLFVDESSFYCVLARK